MNLTILIKSLRICKNVKYTWGQKLANKNTTLRSAHKRGHNYITDRGVGSAVYVGHFHSYECLVVKHPKVVEFHCYMVPTIYLQGEHSRLLYHQAEVSLQKDVGTTLLSYYTNEFSLCKFEDFVLISKCLVC